MAGERLHEFGIDLGEYVMGQIRPHLRGLTRRPVRPLTPLDYDGFHRLTMPVWLGREVATLPAPLSDHVWAGVLGDQPSRSLADAELAALELTVADPPLRCEAECVWEPYSALHRQYVESIPEVREALTRQTAEEWAEASAGFAARLCEEGLSIACGIAVVREWVWYARRLLREMGATEHLSASAVSDRTPTTPSPYKMPTRGTKEPRRATGTADRGGNPHAPAEMLSPARITRRFDVSRSTIYAACRSGVLPHYRVPARPGARGKYLLREADVVAWLESLRVAAGTPTPSASAPASSGSPAGLFSELNTDRLAKAWNSR